MNIHGSCAAREGKGVLLTGPPGSGKSDLLLRLLSHGFSLVADDRIDVAGLMARPPTSLAGLLEVRGLGILRLPYVPEVELVLAIELTRDVPRLPLAARHHLLDLPLLRLDPGWASAPERVGLALDCALGHTPQVAGAFAE
jgi:HPr kinase/phosphorylase